MKIFDSVFEMHPSSDSTGSLNLAQLWYGYRKKKTFKLDLGYYNWMKGFKPAAILKEQIIILQFFKLNCDKKSCY